MRTSGLQAFLVAILATVALGVVADATSLNVCKSYKNVCDDMLSNIKCAPSLKESKSCVGDDILTYGATHVCKCGKFDLTDRQGELLVDKVLKGAPLAKLTRKTSSNVTDVCKTYLVACKYLLKTIGCHRSMRMRSACKHDSLATFEPVCSCGSPEAGFDASGRVEELINDAQLAALASANCSASPNNCTTDPSCPLVCK